MAAPKAASTASISRSCSVEECKKAQYKNAYCLEHYRAYVHSGRLAPQTTPIPKTIGKVVYVHERCPVVLISYADLVAKKDLSVQIKAAFGNEGLGILAISGVPEFTRLRAALLPLAHRMSALPAATKSSLEVKNAQFLRGWSHGQEVFYGKPDTLKSSFYANPLYDSPYDAYLARGQFPVYSTPNVWPRTDLPELETAFKNMGQLIYDVSLLLGSEIDAFCKSRLGQTYMQSSKVGRLTNTLKSSRAHSARLIHYLPQEADSVESKSSGGGTTEQKEYDLASWMPWHNDISSLTGLVPAMYLDSEGKEIATPDGDHGLYIKSREEKVIQVLVPGEYLCFQMGESFQIHCGGVFQATPHCVKSFTAAGSPGVSRASFAFYLQPGPEDAMTVPMTMDPSKALEGTMGKFLTRHQPSLESRWRESKDFHSFADGSRRAYAAVPLTTLESFEGLATSGAMTTSVAPSSSSGAAAVYPVLSAPITTASPPPAKRFAAPKFAAPKSAAASTSTSASSSSSSSAAASVSSSSSSSSTPRAAPGAGAGATTGVTALTCTGCGSRFSDSTAKFCSTCGIRAPTVAV